MHGRSGAQSALFRITIARTDSGILHIDWSFNTSSCRVAHGITELGCTFQGAPTHITIGSKVLFGASTRLYVLTHRNNHLGHLKRAAEGAVLQPRKQGRFDEGHADVDRSAPEPVKGQFADAIKSELRPAQTTASPTNPTPKSQQEMPARTKPEFQKFVASHLKRPAVGQGSSLYDRLPPEKQTTTMQ